MKKVLFLDTSVATLNIGDEIINCSIKKNFKEIFRDNYIFNLPTHTKTFSVFQRCLYPARMKPYLTADYKFLCGTNALYTNMLRPMPTWNINYFNTGLVKDTILLGVGLGVNSKSVNYYTKLLYKEVLSKKFVHSVRDEETKKFLNDLGFEAYNTGCPTLWGLNKKHCSMIPSKKSEQCVFTLTNYNSDYSNDLAMIESIVKNYKNVYFFPQSVDDIAYFKKLCNYTNINIIGPNLLSYEELLNAGNIDYVGNRLHGGIFAMQHKVRSIIVAIDYRATNMHSNYNFTCIDRKAIAEKLDGLINSEWCTNLNGIDSEKIKLWKRQFVDG